MCARYATFLPSPFTGYLLLALATDPTWSRLATGTSKPCLCGPSEVVRGPSLTSCSPALRSWQLLLRRVASSEEGQECDRVTNQATRPEPSVEMEPLGHRRHATSFASEELLEAPRRR